MRVCLVQYDIVWEDKPANMFRCERFFKSAAEQGAELIVFPEMTLTGFSMRSDLAEAPDGDTCRFFGRLSAEYCIPCVFGYAEHRGNELYNRLAFADCSGMIQKSYAKIHPFTIGGEEYFAAGNELVSISQGGLEIGLTICYDLRFPELYTKLSDRCHAVIVSASFPASRREHWLTLLRARAIENQCYILGCNRTGYGGGIEYGGDSVVYSPDGREVAYAGCGEQLLLAEIDAKAVNELRKAFPVKNDRRIEIYRNFYE